MSLARELGYANVDRLAASITAAQLEEWKIFFRLENEARPGVQGSSQKEPPPLADRLESAFDGLIERQKHGR